MINFLTIGIALGLSAGFSPGPLLTLLFSETLQHGTKAGIKVALAPIICDLPIILLTYFILAKLSNFHSILGIISLIGGILICYMGYESIHSKQVIPSSENKESKSLTKGMLVNVLNPYPYLFWLTVGAPTLTKAMNINGVAPILFIGAFYTMLVGSKVVLALLIGRSITFFSGGVYRYILYFLSFVLFSLAFVLFRDGLKLLGIL